MRRAWNIAARVVLWLIIGLLATVATSWSAVPLVDFSNAAETSGRAVARFPPEGGSRYATALVRYETVAATHFFSMALPDEHGDFVESEGNPSPTDIARGWSESIVLPAVRRSFEPPHTGHPGWIEIDAFGWPWRAFWCEYQTERENGVLHISAHGAITIADERLNRPGYIGPYPPALPFRPVASGLLADSIFYGAAGWVLISGSRMLRKAVRRWRGRCARCAYDLTGITGPCPECGGERERSS